MNTSPKTTPRGPSSTQPLKGNKISQRGLFSLITLLVSITLITASFLGGLRLVTSVFNEGLKNAFEGVWYKAVVIGIAYLLGWLVALVSIRVYSNLVLPIIINIYTWVCMIAICILYIIIMQKLYVQKYDVLHYLSYLTVIAGGLAAMVGLHLIIEEHDLRPFSIPLLIINSVQFCLILYRYIFTAHPDPAFLWKDLFFYAVMLIFAVLMLAHTGILKPLREALTHFFDHNSKIIRAKK